MINIMLVDENAGTRMVITNMLEKLGLKVMSAGDANMALSILKSAIPDLFVIDVTTLDFANHDFYQQLRTYQTTKQSSVIFLLPADPTLQLKMGQIVRDETYLYKPITTHQLVTLIREQLAL